MMRRRDPYSNFDRTEFEYTLRSGETVFVVGYAKVLAPEYGVRELELKDFSINVMRDDTDPDTQLTCMDLKGEWSLIEDIACDKLYQEFEERSRTWDCA